MNKQNKAFLLMQTFMMILSMASTTTIGGQEVKETKAEITSPYVRIWLSRGNYYDWNDQGFTPLAYSDTGFELDPSIYNLKNINYIPPTGYVQDPGYYGGLTCTTAHYSMGLLYYDIEISKIENKYVTFMYFTSKTTSDSPKYKVRNIKFSLAECHTNSDIWLLTYMAIFFDLTENPYDISNSTLGKILEGYLTCSSSAYNGYNAYPTLNKHFNLEGRTYGDETMVDYTYNNGNYDYSTAKGNNKQLVKVEDKAKALKAQYEAGQVTSNKTYSSINISTTTFISIIFFSLLSLGASFIYFAYRRKNKRR